MKRWLLSAVLVTVVCLQGVFSWAAVLDTAESVITLTVPSISSMTVDDGELNVSPIQISELTQGYRDLGTVGVAFQSNEPWEFEMAVSEFTAPYDKSFQHLTFMVSSFSSEPITIHNGFSTGYTAMDVANQFKLVASGRAMEQTLLDILMKVDLELGRDVPGDYTIVVTYTLKTAG